LLNNDVKLDRGAVGPLIRALEEHPDALFSAPQCWTFDGQAYEGMRTRVRMRYGLVQGRCRVPGYEQAVDQPDLTASAGPVLAVDRARFLALGGYDPLYFPGRIEDLDLGFAGWVRGWKGYYVPESVAYHQGFASFEPEFGRAGCEHLAARNSLLFAWKNLTGRKLFEHLAWLPARLAYAVARRRSTFLAAFRDACSAVPNVLAQRRLRPIADHEWARRQDAYFRQFRW
jgi:GT2 family glycosyltransferase